MFKNVAAKFIVFAFDATTNVPKIGDAANITAYVSKDYGTVTVLADTSATEMDATNAPGYYLFDAAQGETNGDCLLVSAKSATANIKVIGAPAVIYTRPTTGWLAPATAGRTLVVDAAGLADANVVKLGPTGAGTAQTARDLGLSILLAANQHVIVDSGTVTTVTNQLTAAQIATGVWRDTTAGDFTVVGSVGEAVFNILTAVTIDAAFGSVGADTNALISRVGNPSNLGSGGTVAANLGDVFGSKTGYKLASDGLDLVLVAGKTLPVAIKYIGASVAGVVSGAGTGTEIFKDYAGATAFTVTVDVNGNRSVVVYA